MLLRLWVSFAFLALLVSCNGWNSELNTQYIPDAKQKTCQFMEQPNCLQRSIDLLADCVQTENSEIFTDDFRACGDGDKKWVQFERPVSMQEPLLAMAFGFRIYNGSQKCMRFRGGPKNFMIDENPHGQLSLKTLEDGSLEINCFGAESIKVESTDLAGQCSPFNYFTDPSTGVLQVGLKGSLDRSLDLFRCQ